MRAFSWINYLLRPLTQVIHWKVQLCSLETAFYIKSIWKLLNSYQQKFCWALFVLTYNSSFFLWLQSCYATSECWNPVIQRGVSWWGVCKLLFGDPSSKAWADIGTEKKESEEWSCLFFFTILFVLPILWIATCKCWVMASANICKTENAFGIQAMAGSWTE